MFKAADDKYGSNLSSCKIVASNDINEPVLHSLREQGHEIDCFGIGTNLVTCQAQPALGMVYKLVEINGVPRIKLSQDMAKVTLPGAKEAYRLIGSEGVPLLDVIVRVGEPRPAPGKRVLCRHPFDEKKRAWATPSAVIPLLRLVWKGAAATLEEKLTTDAAFAAAALAATGGGGAGLGHPAGLAFIPPEESGLVPVSDDTLAAAASSSGSSSTTASSSSAAKADGPAGTDGPASASGGAGASLLSPSVLPAGVNLRAKFPPAKDVRQYVKAQLAWFREDHLRPVNPTPYKVSVSADLFHFCHDLWMKEVPIAELL